MREQVNFWRWWLHHSYPTNLVWWVLTFVVTYLILDFTLTPEPETVASPNRRLPHALSNLVETLINEGGHVVAFAVFASVLYLAIVTAPWLRIPPRLVVVIGTLLLGAGMEIGQGTVPGRTGTISDGLLDLGGGLVGLAITWSFYSYCYLTNPPK